MGKSPEGERRWLANGCSLPNERQRNRVGQELPETSAVWTVCRTKPDLQPFCRSREYANHSKTEAYTPFNTVPLLSYW